MRFAFDDHEEQQQEEELEIARRQLPEVQDEGEHPVVQGRGGEYREDQQPAAEKDQPTQNRENIEDRQPLELQAMISYCVIYTNVHNFAYNQDYYLFKSLKIIILLLQRYKAMACECPSPELFEPVKKHLLHYSKPQDTEAWKALGVSALYVLVVIYLNVSGHPFLGWSFQGLVTVRLFVQFHDMAHYSFFSSVSLNRLVGTLLGILVHFPFDAWRNGHNHHHKVFGNIDRLDLSQTILFTKKQYEEMPRTKRMLVRIFREPVIFFLISAPFIWFFALYFHIAKRYGILSQPFAEKVLSMVFVCVICPLVGISPLGMFLSTYLADVIGTALFHLQHSVNLPYRERK